MTEGRRGKRRRVVAPATNAQPEDAPPRAAPRGPSGEQLLPDRAAEDTDGAWGQHAADSNDDRLLEDKPPHWQ